MILRRLLVALAVLAFTVSGTSAFATDTALAQGSGPQFTRCYNKSIGKVIEVPVRAAVHLSGHGGWFCGKIKLPKGPIK